MHTHTDRHIVACRVLGIDDWYYLCDDPKGRYGGYILSRFNADALTFASLSDLTPEMRRDFDAVAEALGMGRLDWTQARAIAITTARTETAAIYNAITGALTRPKEDALPNHMITALAAQCRAGLDSPGGIRLDMLDQVAEALEQLRDVRTHLQARLQEAPAASSRPHTPPIWLNAAPPECPAH
jgi:hypothetical protein